MNLTSDDVQNILRIIDSPCVELHLETADFKLFVRKAGDLRSGASPLPLPTSAATSAAPSVSNDWKASAAPVVVGADAAAEVATTPAKPERPLAAGESAIFAPMVGTFYRAPEPGAAPFVEVGDIVEAESVVCILEVMKLMNSIRAERRGCVVEILVQNAQLVENGQPLIILGAIA